MQTLFIIGGILLIMIVSAFLYSRKRGQFKLAQFLQSFGIDMSEGIESLIYGIRTIILLALEFVFAHLEADNLASVMPYREGSYTMGLALALVAMVAGMTFATEMNLQVDRRKNILPHIEAMGIEEDVRDQMLHIYWRKYNAAKWMMWTSLFVAIGMHAAIVLMGLFSLWQHESYAVSVLKGAIQPIEGMPPLNYTMWFNMPLVVSSIMVGAMGFVIDVILGMTSNIVEELYKYKPNKEILDTVKELEAEYGGSYTPAPRKKPTTTPTTKPTTTSNNVATGLENDWQGFVDQLNSIIPLSLNYTGTEETWKLISDIITEIGLSGLGTSTTVNDVDTQSISDKYNNGTTALRQKFTDLAVNTYTTLLQKIDEEDNCTSVVSQGITMVREALDAKDLSKADSDLGTLDIAMDKVFDVHSDMINEVNAFVIDLKQL